MESDEDAKGYPEDVAEEDQGEKEQGDASMLIGVFRDEEDSDDEHRKQDQPTTF